MHRNTYYIYGAVESAEMAETAEMAEILTNGGRCIKMTAAIYVTYVRTKVTEDDQYKVEQKRTPYIRNY